MNTIITFATILVLLVGSLVIFINSDIPRWWIAAGLVFLALAIPPLIDPFTRTFWTAIDIAMRPLEAHEVDWTIVAPVSVNDDDGNTDGNNALTSPDLPNEDQ